MDKKLIGLIFAITFVFGMMFLRPDVRAQSAPANQTGGSRPANGPNARGGFKNLRVLTELNDAPQAELLSAMSFISGSLSVSCDYCHVLVSGTIGQFNFDSDDKKTKAIARGSAMKSRIRLAFDFFSIRKQGAHRDYAILCTKSSAHCCPSGEAMVRVSVASKDYCRDAKTVRSANLVSVLFRAFGKPFGGPLFLLIAENVMPELASTGLEAVTDFCRLTR